jgi:hypothetical protein
MKPFALIFLTTAPRSSLAPWVVGFFADSYGIGSAPALIFTLQETKRAELS